MDSFSEQLDASADADIPPPAWAALLNGARRITAHALPAQTVALRVMVPAEIRRLNREFRGVDAVTDVLSFPGGGLAGYAGDIALCWEAAAQQAIENGNTPAAEALALFAHGILHLAGLDHDTDEAERAMNAKVRELCRLAGVEVNGFGH